MQRLARPALVGGRGLQSGCREIALQPFGEPVDLLLLALLQLFAREHRAVRERERR